MKTICGKLAVVLFVFLFCGCLAGCTAQSDDTTSSQREMNSAASVNSMPSGLSSDEVDSAVFQNGSYYQK